MAPTEFPFCFHPAFRVAAMPFLVRPGNCCVTVSDSELTALYGPWSVRTPLSNVAGATVSEGYSWPKTIGPAHLSLSDRGLTFASNPDAGVCMEFRRPVRGIDPLGLILHPGLTVTVDQPAVLAELLGRHAG
jgi:hypothetical protein